MPVVGSGSVLSVGAESFRKSPQFSRKWRSSLFLKILSDVPVTVCSGKQFQLSHTLLEQERRVVARKPRDAAAVLFGLKFADDIHYKFKSSYTSFEAFALNSVLCRYVWSSEASSSGDSRSFKVTCFLSQWKGDKALSNTI